MNEAEYFTQEYREETAMNEGEFNLEFEDIEMMTVFESEWNALEKRIADLEMELLRQTNRALKWRRQAAYYKLREMRCMGEANYTSVERVDDLEAQRDELAAALREIEPITDIGNLFDGHDELNEYTHEANEELLTRTLDRLYEIVTEALKRLEGENATDRL